MIKESKERCIYSRRFFHSIDNNTLKFKVFHLSIIPKLTEVSKRFYKLLFLKIMNLFTLPLSQQTQNTQICHFRSFWYIIKESQRYSAEFLLYECTRWGGYLLHY